MRWLFGAPAFDRQPDRIFLTSAAMLDDLLSRCRQELTSHERVLVVAHFPVRLEEVRSRLEQQQIACDILGKSLSAENLSREVAPRTLTLVLADELHGDVDARKNDDDQTQTSILVAEHHPTRRHDEAIERFAAGVSGQVRRTYFAALDEPLMARFSGGWVTETLQKLGMQADACIESAMVARSLAGAQRKVEATAQSDEPADSAAEWFDRNLPGSSA